MRVRLSRRTAVHACRGGSVLETMLVLALIATLILVALDRFVTVRVEAERVAMEAVVQALRATVLEHVLHGRVTADRGQAINLQGENPMRWLDRPPPNYLGELAGPDPANIPGGQWYFDTHSHLLVYRVDHAAYFDTVLPGTARIRFKLGVENADTSQDGRLVPDTDDAHGLSITALDHYSWRRSPFRVGALAVWGVFGTTP